jgi:hypothetical protein
MVEISLLRRCMIEDRTVRNLSPATQQPQRLQKLESERTQRVCDAGTVISIATNNGITGGTIIGSGTIRLAPIGRAQILANPTAGNGVPVALLFRQKLMQLWGQLKAIFYTGRPLSGLFLVSEPLAMFCKRKVRTRIRNGHQRADLAPALRSEHPRGHPRRLLHARTDIG